MAPPAQRSPDIEPMRQGFVGYINVEGLQWRVMLRLRLEDEAWGLEKVEVEAKNHRMVRSNYFANEGK